MSSKPPPLPPRAPLVNASAIVASLAVSFALVVTVVAWIVTHPHRATAHAAPPEVAVRTPAPIVDPPPPRPVPAVEVVPVFHHSSRAEVLLRQVPRIEEAPPPLPPPVEPEPIKEPPAAARPPAPPAGETYGTAVLFLNNPQMAGDVARHDHKLLFVMHISGNFEDSCFT